MNRRCAIVVPCYNEAGRLDTAAFVDYLWVSRDTKLIFVNDGSTDDTMRLLRTIQDRSPQVEILDKPKNGGKAEAIRDGMRYALGLPGVIAVGFWDADLATPLEAIPDLLGVLDARREIDVVLGSRVMLLGRDINRRTARHYLGRLFATCASMVLGLPVYDTQCGAKLFRVTPALAGILDAPFLSRWIFDVELIARLIEAEPRTGRRVRDCMYEFPLYRWRDVPGSKVKARDFFRAALELWRIYRKYFRSLRPEAPRVLEVRDGSKTSTKAARQGLNG
jgi:dolichyl-phosphate beta-glucosyltransferase